jgi:ribosomal protein S3
MGKIGIKVWIFKKLFFAKTPRELREQLLKMEAENPTEIAVMDEAAQARREAKKPDSSN